MTTPESAPLQRPEANYLEGEELWTLVRQRLGAGAMFGVYCEENEPRRLLDIEEVGILYQLRGRQALLVHGVTDESSDSSAAMPQMSALALPDAAYVSVGELEGTISLTWPEWGSHSNFNSAHVLTIDQPQSSR